MHMCVAFEVSTPNLSGVIDINVAKREQIWLPNEHSESADLHLQT